MGKLCSLVCGLLLVVLFIGVPAARARHAPENFFVADGGGGGGGGGRQGTSPKPCFPAIFAMGDSLLDKGNDLILHPLERGFLYNETYMSRPRDVETDGRLIIDFIAQAFGLASPSPYLEGVRPDYRNGVNFATFGATVTGVPFMVPYTLDIQSYWLTRFMENVFRTSNSSTGSSSSTHLPSIEDFEKGLYVIAAGGNDYTALARIFDLPTVKTNVSQVVSKLNSTIVSLMSAGARNFLIVNIPPIGCFTHVRESYTSAASSTNTRMHPDLDEHGCVRPLNEIVDLHNSQLRQVLQNLRNQHSSRTFIYADYNGVTRQMFISRTARATAGRCSSGVCYNNVDTTSEAANKLATFEFLTGEFVEPRGAFSQCTLDLRLN